MKAYTIEALATVPAEQWGVIREASTIQGLAAAPGGGVSNLFVALSGWLKAVVSIKDTILHDSHTESSLVRLATIKASMPGVDRAMEIKRARQPLRDALLYHKV